MGDFQSILFKSMIHICTVVLDTINETNKQQIIQSIEYSLKDTLTCGGNVFGKCFLSTEHCSRS